MGVARDIKIITADNTIKLEGKASKGGGMGARRGLMPARFIFTFNSDMYHSKMTLANWKCFHQEKADFRAEKQHQNKDR